VRLQLVIQFQFISLFRKKQLIFYSAIYVFFRFMEVLENTMNLPICGLFLLFLLAMCLDALSFVTVNTSFTNSLQALLFINSYTVEQCMKNRIFIVNGRDECSIVLT